MDYQRLEGTRELLLPLISNRNRKYRPSIPPVNYHRLMTVQRRTNVRTVTLDRDVQSSKMVHAALLLLTLGARTTVTPFHHQPEAQHPKIFQLSASRLPITPSLLLNS